MTRQWKMETMSATVKLSNRPAIQFDVNQSADLLVLPPDSQIKGNDAPAGFESGTEHHHNAHARGHSLRHSTKHDHSSKTRRDWLRGDPFGWRDRKIRHRKTRVVYTVRQVFKSGRVELQKSFMSYLTNVRTIQKDYETYC